MTADRVDELQAAYRKIVAYKYLLLLAALLSTIPFFFIIVPEAGSQLASLRDLVLFSGIVSLIISLLNDVVLKQQSETQAKMERDKFASQFASAFFDKYANDAISDRLLSDMILLPARRVTVIDTLSRLVVDDVKLREHVCRSYFDPIDRPPKYKDLVAVSRLSSWNSKDGSYLWSCEQKFTSFSKEIDFRVFVCTDPDLAAKMEGSGRALDFIVLLSDFDYNETKTWLDSNFKLIGRYIDSATHKPMAIEVRRSFDVSELVGSIADVAPEKGLYCHFSATSPQENTTYTLTFKHKLSLKDDPFFCWTFQEFAFVNSVEVDYSGLLPAVGRVSMVPFIRSALSQIEHNQTEGSFKVSVGDLVGPGEGFVLVYRQKE